MENKDKEIALDDKTVLIVRIIKLTWNHNQFARRLIVINSKF